MEVCLLSVTSDRSSHKPQGNLVQIEPSDIKLTFAGLKSNKTCPDFKAPEDSVYCCVSKLPSTGHTTHHKERLHTYFCCTEADFEKEQQEIADAEFKNFIKE